MPAPTFKPEDLVLLGYRPRRPCAIEADFFPPGVTVASASDCIVNRVLPDEPDWEHMNMARHYETPADAIAAAVRAGAEPGTFEVHATRLMPVCFDGRSEHPFTLNLGQTAGRPSSPQPSGTLFPLGFDVPSISQAQLKDPGPVCDWLPFDCAPLSCNGMWKNHPVNRWCLIDELDKAVAAARDFAVSEPEPGPFVVVQVLRVEQ